MLRKSKKKITHIYTCDPHYHKNASWTWTNSLFIFLFGVLTPHFNFTLRFDNTYVLLSISLTCHSIWYDKIEKEQKIAENWSFDFFQKKIFFLLLSSTKKNDEEKENRKCMIVSVVSLIYFNCEIQFFLSISIQSDLYLSFCLYVSQKQSFFSIHS